MRLLADRFPAVAANINEIDDGLLHLEMSVLSRATRHAIESDEFSGVRAHLELIDEVFIDTSPYLENAVYVSYLEEVFLGEESPRYRAARKMLSQRLETALLELEKHWRNIAEAAKRDTI